MDSNKLAQLPEEIGRLQSLYSLTVSKNKLKTLPAAIGTLSSIVTIRLDENILEELPAQIWRLENLRNLSLRGNLIQQLPKGIGRLRSLYRLNLSDNQIESLPSEIGELGTLRNLELDGNRIFTIPEEFAALSKLDILSLQGNQISEFPGIILKLPSLRALYLGHNQIRGVLPGIAEMIGLERLWLQGNAIQHLPPEIAKLSRLHVLQLTDNELVELPAELGQVRSLEEAAYQDFEPWTDGLFVEGNPLPAPYPILIAAGQPSATRNILAWLRGELDPDTIDRSKVTAKSPAAPPPEPVPEVGPSFQISSGRLDVVGGKETASEFDRSTQEALHRRLKRQVSLLRDATRKVNNQHPQLSSIVDEYAALVSPEISELDVVELWAGGNALMATATSFERQDKAKTLTEPLEPEHLTLLLEVSGLHGAFILGFPRGVELADRADRAQFDLDTIRAISAPTSNVLSALARQHRVLSDRARSLIEALDAALLPGSWEVARIGFTSYAVARNALVVIGRIAIWINEKGGSLAGGTIIAAAVSQANIPTEVLQQVISFLQSNSSQILSFAAPFPELRAYMQWIIDFFDSVEKSGKQNRRNE